MELVRIALTFLGALVVFTLGLLAWRQQLLDKRKFEVAEAVLLAFTKLEAAIESVRSSRPQGGASDYVTKELGIDPGNRYSYYMGVRKWYYRITPEQREELTTAFKEFTSAWTLASIYLPEAPHIMSAASDYYWKLLRAATVLGEIDPRPPSGEYWEDWLHDLPDYDDDPEYEPIRRRRKRRKTFTCTFDLSNLKTLVTLTRSTPS